MLNTKKNDPSNVISYARGISSNEYGAVRDQTEMIADYAAKNNLKIVKVFETLSTRHAKREFEYVLLYCQYNPGIKYLLVTNFSRVSRNQKDYYAWEKAFLEAGVKIKSITQPTDDSVVGEFMEALHAKARV